MTRLAKIADRLADVPLRASVKAGRLIEEIAADEARRATGDGRFGGTGRRGPKLRAVSRTRSVGRGASTMVRGIPPGFWAILNSGAKPHVMKPKRARVLYGRNMRHPVAGPIRHPGARGKRTWTRVVTEARSDVPDLFRDAVAKAIR